MRILQICPAVLAVVLSSSVALAATDLCKYQIDSNSIQVNWTAFKTNQKAPVAGGFSEVTLAGDLQDKDLATLLGQLEAEIPVSDAEKIRTGNPARDQTLYQHFFGLIKNKSLLKGVIKSVKVTPPAPEAKLDSDTTGTFDLKLTINQKSNYIPFKFALSPDGAFVANGSMNVLDFGLSNALAALHKACEALHTGADGVSKTWPEVDLKLSATIRRSCN